MDIFIVPKFSFFSFLIIKKKIVQSQITELARTMRISYLVKTKTEKKIHPVTLVLIILRSLLYFVKSLVFDYFIHELALIIFNKVLESFLKYSHRSISFLRFDIISPIFLATHCCTASKYHSFILIYSLSTMTLASERFIR